MKMANSRQEGKDNCNKINSAIYSCLNCTGNFYKSLWKRLINQYKTIKIDDE
jgi:hypothetical protein